MFTISQWRTVKSLEHDVGFKFELTSPPVVEEVLESSVEQVVATLNGVHPSLWSSLPQLHRNLLKKKRKRKRRSILGL